MLLITKHIALVRIVFIRLNEIMFIYVSSKQLLLTLLNNFTFISGCLVINPTSYSIKASF